MSRIEEGPMLPLIYQHVLQRARDHQRFRRWVQEANGALVIVINEDGGERRIRFVTYAEIEAFCMGLMMGDPSEVQV